MIRNQNQPSIYTIKKGSYHYLINTSTSVTYDKLQQPIKNRIYTTIKASHHVIV